MDREVLSFECNPSVVRPHPGEGVDEGETQMTFKLKARINRSDARTIRQALHQLAAKGSVKGKRENSPRLLSL
jgi:hypothetical protein